MAVLIVCCCLCLAGWWWLLRRMAWSPAGRVSSEGWRPNDAVAAALFALFYIYGIFVDDGRPVTLNDDVIKSSVFTYLMFSSFVIALVYLGGRKPGQVFGFVPAGLWWKLGLAIVCLFLTFPLVSLLSQTAELVWKSPSTGDEMVQYLQGKLSIQDAIWAAALASIVAPFTEELIFRGFFYGVAKKYCGSLAAMGTTALLFAAIHQNPPAIPALFCLALGFTLAYEITG
ncbi:MAG TPA: type II CAAX endopeptidase family protein, partial [Chthoniobacterales bacterium]|nr:type II CAAX endopeptidase family protein [Chthoniobacterales bacterium]